MLQVIQSYNTEKVIKDSKVILYSIVIVYEKYIDF